MKKNKLMMLVMVTLVLLIAVVYGLIKNRDAELDISNPVVESTPEEIETTLVEGLLIETTFSADELNSSWDNETATSIALADSTARVDGAGATFENGVVTVRQAGTYVLSGQSKDIQVVVDANKDTDTVKLVLNGVTMTHTSSAPIYIKTADKTIVTLAEGTTNVLSDTENYVFATGEDEPSAPLFSKDDLVINGTGSLRIEANYKNGIQSKDDLKIVSGNITINALNDGIKGKDSVAIRDGSFNLTTGGDGIQSSNDTDTSKGWVSLLSGTYVINAEGDGIQAETILQTVAGTYTINTHENTTENSNKGLKATATLAVYGGTYTLDTIDDALHSNGDVIINDGNFTIRTGDDGMHADANLTIQSGTILILESYEGLEGASVTINGGDITLTASDDGINAAGGNDTQETGGPRVDQFTAGGDFTITINGGRLEVDAGGDGIDSNGDLIINGGEVLVNGPVSDGDGALDFDGQSTISGGTLLTFGSSGMLQMPGETSTQNVLAIGFNNTQSAGTEFVIKDSSGNVITNHVATKQFSAVVFSSKDLLAGETYQIYANGTNITDVTLESVVTAQSETGEALSTMGGPGGMGAPGGAGGPGGRR
ncbi:carbohydrate-binding domain-containing protein [Erysipelothrix sp. HDW6C]|uniref:carbohydrate-binding domain-containing protein n=1 Tax=Erysipelothrix sp. HDW6C TaxID=2714930 RepID=UPI0014073088|nr:carbohydrate-binding domain-containing protein [Erysipelothrix sp. HDW6C]QIK69523.1 carbohydrate-binding domain-containing protein [Erysipelothrix sp. HDW6C]